MEISNKGIVLIKLYEDCKLTAYKCPSGKWTIGYGHTGLGAYEGATITLERAKSWLMHDLKLRSKNVTDMLHVKVNQNQFDALVSLMFNIGYGNFVNSSILRCVNAGAFEQAAWHFYHENQGAKTPEERYKGCWVFDNNKKVLLGLVRRRKAERDLFISKYLI